MLLNFFNYSEERELAIFVDVDSLASTKEKLSPINSGSGLEYLS